MHYKTVDKPTNAPIKGEVSESLVILSRSEIRNAEILEAQQELQTADGFVIGRPEDVVVTAYGGERYPIPKSVFYGTYEVIGQVGRRLVARRLIHTRRAWPVVSDNASFDYGSDRGTVTVAKGAWLYQTDDADFGVINPDVKHKGHTEAGAWASLSRDWEAWFDRGMVILAFLPTVLTLLALVAFAFSTHPGGEEPGKVFLGAETTLLMGGALLVWVMRRWRWGVRASVKSARENARHFQSAARLLGHGSSDIFPSMSLWRAAQLPPEAATGDLGPLIEEVKSAVGSTLASVRKDVTHHQRVEKLAEASAAGATVAILMCNAYLIFVAPGFTTVELFAIWLPSLIGALHTFNSRRQVVQRLASVKEFSAQLKFVQDHLLKLAPNAAPDLSDPQKRVDLQATLAVLCKIVAQYCQRQIQFALAESPELPV